MSATPVRRVTVVAALLTTLLLAACGGEIQRNSPSASRSAASFPPSQFPPQTYKGLSGSLTVYDSDGGSSMAAKGRTIYQNFTDLTGVRVSSDFNSDTSKFLAAMQAGTPQWNVIEFPTVGDFINAKKHGYLEKLDPAIVPVNKLQDGTYDPYGYHVEQYGIVLAWNTKKWPSSGPHPTSMTDLFNTKQFPGKRCLFKYPEFGATLESALLADGVAPSQLYPLDVDRAFAKLNTIKNDIVWWDGGERAIQYLTSGECDLGVAWSGRVFNAVERQHLPLDFTWNQALFTSGVLAIPKNAPNPRAAQALLAMWIHDQQGQREFLSTGVPYPTPITGVTYPASLSKWLPLGENLKQAIAENDEYYAANIDELSKRFTAWVGGSS
jgi:putative spermidine/putrescine transport system substrate-binding protein